MSFSGNVVTIRLLSLPARRRGFWGRFAVWSVLIRAPPELGLSIRPLFGAMIVTWGLRRQATCFRCFAAGWVRLMRLMNGGL